MGSIKSNGYLTGKLLLAMPNMEDSRFHRAVIFICSHDEKGAMGLVINHTLPELSFYDLVDQLKIQSDIKIDLHKIKFPVMNGGPVESARGFLLHSADFKRMETTTVNDHYGITGTVEALKDVVRGQGPEKLLFILGYAGWTAGQLDMELQQNAWLVVDPDPSIIFHGIPEEKWTMGIVKLGINPAMLSGAAGRA
jgi:putative transcriptional regulator